MFIRILNETSNELRIEIEGEGHAFCNSLQKVLLEDIEVEVAGYNIQHPLTSNPVIYVHTKGTRKPEMALRDAVKTLQNRINEFQKVFEKALEESDNVKV